jgi:hypothetical protein
VLLEVHDDWQTIDRRYLSEASMRRIDQPQEIAIDERNDLPAPGL